MSTDSPVVRFPNSFLVLGFLSDQQMAQEKRDFPSPSHSQCHCSLENWGRMTQRKLICSEFPPLPFHVFPLLSSTLCFRGRTFLCCCKIHCGLRGTRKGEERLQNLQDNVKAVGIWKARVTFLFCTIAFFCFLIKNFFGFPS